MTTPDPTVPTTHTSTRVVPQVVPKWFPNRVQGTRDESGSPVPHIFDGEPLSEPSATGSRNHGNHTAPDWLLTARCRPAWEAALDYLADGRWHPVTELSRIMQTTSDITPRTVHNHLARAGRRGWTRRKHGQIKLRDRHSLEAAISAAADIDQVGP